MSTAWAHRVAYVTVWVVLVGVLVLLVGLTPALIPLVRPYLAELGAMLVCMAIAAGAAIVIVRTRTLGPYVPELLILVVGLVTGVIASVTIAEKAIAVITVILAFLLSVSTFAVKREVATSVAAVSRLHVAQRQIHNPRWRRDADERVQDLELEIAGWVGGQRTIARERSIPYQIALLESASRSVDAIHVALDRESLSLWDKDSGKFSALVAAHERLPRPVRKRRILILDDTDPTVVMRAQNGARMVVDPTARRVCARQLDPKQLGVDLRLLWRSKVGTADGDLPRDLLLVDEEEAIVVTLLSDARVYETQAFVEPTPVRGHQRRFERYWAVAIPASLALPSADSLRSSGPDPQADVMDSRGQENASAE